MFLHLATLINRLLPIEMRDFHAIWLYALLNPLKLVNSHFVAFANDKRYRIAFNSQVIYLEHVLNDMFDPIDRTIIIEDGDLELPVYSFDEDETQEGYYTFNESETSSPQSYIYDELELTGVHFFVKVPTTISLTDIRLISFINYYKAASKTYKIIH